MSLFSRYIPSLCFVIFSLFFYQEGRSQCEITSIQTGTQSPCDPATNTYSQEITVYFQNPPADNLITLNEQTFLLDPSQQGFFQTRITGLPSHGKKVPAHAFFTSQPACSLIISSAFTAPAPCKSYILQPTLQDFIAEDVNRKDSIDAGDFLSYLARISNNTASTVNDVTFGTLPPLDPNLIIDPQSVQIAPIALPDTIGLNQIGGYDLLQNDIDPDGAAADLIIVAVDNFSANGGTITLSTNCEGIQYTPPAGTFSSDQFEYVIMDPDGMISSATVVLEADLDIDPTKVIYVNNDPPASVTGTLGTTTNPYTTLADAQGHVGAELIYVFEGNAAYDMGIALSDGQYLIGEGAGLKCGGCALEEPAGTAPVFTNTSTTTNDGHAVILAKNNTVQGIKIENTKGYAFANASSSSPDSVGELYIDIESVTGEGGILLLTACDNQAQVHIQQASSSDTSPIYCDDVSGALYYSGSISATNPGRLMVINACPGAFTFRQHTCSDVISQAVSDGEGILIKNMDGNLAFKVPVHIGTVTTPNGGNHGITLYQNNSGTYSFDSVKIYTKNHTGFWAQDISDQGNLIVKKGSVIADSAAAILIGQLDVDINLAYVESTDSPTDGVAIEGTGDFSCQVFIGTNIGRVCKAVTLELDGTGNATLVPSDIYSGVYGDAADYTFAASPTTFTTPASYPVMLTVTDATNETFSCSAIVTIEPPSTPLPPLPGGFGGASLAGPPANVSPLSLRGRGSGGCSFGMVSTSNQTIQNLANGLAGTMAMSSDKAINIWIGTFISDGAKGAGINFKDALGNAKTSIQVDSILITCGNNCRGVGVIGTNVDEVSLGKGEIETYKKNGVRITNENTGSRIEIDLNDINSTKSVGLVCIGPPSTNTEPFTGLYPVDSIHPSWNGRFDDPTPTITDSNVYETSLFIKGGFIDVFGDGDQSMQGIQDTAVYLENLFLDVTLNSVNASNAEIGIMLKNTTGTFTVLGGTLTRCGRTLDFENVGNISLNDMIFSESRETMLTTKGGQFWYNKCQFNGNKDSQFKGFYVHNGTLSMYDCEFKNNDANLWYHAHWNNAGYIGHSSFEYTGNKGGNPNLHFQTYDPGTGRLVLSNNTYKGFKGWNGYVSRGALDVMTQNETDITISNETFQNNHCDIFLTSGSSDRSTYSSRPGYSSFYILNIDSMAPVSSSLAYPPTAIHIADGVWDINGWKRGIISGIGKIDLGKNTVPTYGITFNSGSSSTNLSRLSIYGDTLVNGGNNNVTAMAIGYKISPGTRIDPDIDPTVNNGPRYLSIKNNTGFYSEIKNSTDLCADITGNVFAPIVTGGTRLKLEQSGLGAFSLEKGSNSTLLSADTILAAENGGVAADYDITGTITPVADGTCNSSSGTSFNDTLVLVTDGYLQEVLLEKDSTIATIPLEVTVIRGDGEPIDNVEVTFNRLNSTLAPFTSLPLTNAKGITQTTVTVYEGQTGWLEFEFEYAGKKASAWIYVNQL